LRSTRSAYSSLEHDVNKLLTLLAAVNRSLITTSSAVRLETRSMPSHGSGICAVHPRLPLARNIISFVLAQLSRKLFLSAQSLTCESSVAHVSLFSAGTITYVSSANLTTLFPLCTGLRSAAITRYVAGPGPDPCITLA